MVLRSTSRAEAVMSQLSSPHWPCISWLTNNLASQRSKVPRNSGNIENKPMSVSEGWSRGELLILTNRGVFVMDDGIFG